MPRQRRDLPPNLLLRAARERLVSRSGSGRPMSRRELAEAVNRYLWETYRRTESLDEDDIGKLERGEHRWPGEHRREALRVVLGAGSDAELGLYINRRPAARGHRLDAGQDEVFDALELARRAAASDVGDGTLASLEQAVDKLAVAYQGTPPAVLLPEVRRHLRYVGQLVDKRATLAQRRRLLVVGGWLSLLASTVEIDLHRRFAARAHLATAASLAEHTEHREIAAWCLETEAWDALTEGQFQRAVELSRAAQAIAPRGESAFIQATAQEGRAWARLGAQREARDALARVEQLVSPLPVPDQPEHHYRYDPAKQVAYTATTLAWLADPAAERHARQLLAGLETAQDGGRRPRRTATARIDLALALVAVGGLDEAAQQTVTALQSGHIVPSSGWRAAEILAAVEAAGLAEAATLREAYDHVVRETG